MHPAARTTQRQLTCAQRDRADRLRLPRALCSWRRVLLLLPTRPARTACGGSRRLRHACKRVALATAAAAICHIHDADGPAGLHRGCRRSHSSLHMRLGSHCRCRHRRCCTSAQPKLRLLLLDTCLAREPKQLGPCLQKEQN